MSIPSYADAPFHCPPDVVLDLPAPISVNKLRRINWAQKKKADEWTAMADKFLLVAKADKHNPVKLEKIPRFEIHLTFSEDHTNVDLDNAVKLVIDYLRYREIILDDGKAHMRRLVVEWGFAAAGCKVVVKPLPLTMRDLAERAANA